MQQRMNWLCIGDPHTLRPVVKGLAASAVGGPLVSLEASPHVKAGQKGGGGTSAQGWAAARQATRQASGAPVMQHNRRSQTSP